ncbi:glycerol-3-phosphate acyltransferase, partial [Striga asiatica]
VSFLRRVDRFSNVEKANASFLFGCEMTCIYTKLTYEDFPPTRKSLPSQCQQLTRDVLRRHLCPSGTGSSSTPPGDKDTQNPEASLPEDDDASFQVVGKHSKRDKR